jgi:hypothetical protein
MSTNFRWGMVLLTVMGFLFFNLVYCGYSWSGPTALSVFLSGVAAVAVTLAFISGYQIGAETEHLDKPMLTQEDLLFDSMFKRGPKATGASYQDNYGKFRYRTREQHEAIMQSKGVYK